MISQPPFPNQEVRWERKTKQRWAPATPQQSGCPWQRRGGLCQFWATSVPGLLWAQKNVRGEIWKRSLSSGWMAVHRTHSPTLSPIASNLSGLHTEERQNTATGLSLSFHFSSFSGRSSHRPGRVLLLTSSSRFLCEIQTLFGSCYWSFELRLNTLITEDKAKSLKNKRIYRCWFSKPD